MTHFSDDGLYLFLEKINKYISASGRLVFLASEYNFLCINNPDLPFSVLTTIILNHYYCHSMLYFFFFYAFDKFTVFPRF